MDRTFRYLSFIPQKTRDIILWPMVLLFVPIISIAITGFIGCSFNPKAVDDAMKTNITMRGKSFVPPPRSVDDILSVIDREAMKDALNLKNWERQVKNKIPENATRSELIEFYFKRGETAFKLGFFQQSRDDYLKVYEMAGPDYARGGLKIRLAYSELNLQNYDKAIDLFTSVLVRFHHFHPYAELTNVYALIGDFEKAEAMCERGRLVSNHHATSWSDDEVFFKSRLEYTVLNMKAKYKEAEPFIRRALYATIASRYKGRTKSETLERRLKTVTP